MCAGLLIKEKSLKKAKAMVLHFIAQEDPAFGRSSIKQKSSGAAAAPEEFSLPPTSGVCLHSPSLFLVMSVHGAVPAHTQLCALNACAYLSTVS